MTYDVSQRISVTSMVRTVRDGAVLEMGRFKIMEGLLGIALVFAGVAVPGLPVAFPLAYLAAILIVAIGVTRRPLFSMPEAAKVPLLLLLIGLLFTTVVSYFSGYVETTEWIRRLVRVLSVVGMSIVMATGRVDLASVVRGFLLGLAVNVPLSLAGVFEGVPEGYLAGAFADKNQAGLNYAIGGFLALIVYRSVSVRITLTVLFSGLLWLTQSRTAIAAFGVGLVWLFVARRLSAFFRVLLASVLVLGVDFIERNFSRIGAFANREGSDALRERINVNATEKVRETAWFGRGWGQGTVEVDGNTWFFHNAFDVLHVEGGWPLLIAVVAMTMWVGTRILRTTGLGADRVIVQAATFAVLICAWKLGDTFFTVAWGLVMALGLRVWIREAGSRPYGQGRAYGTERGRTP